MYWFNYPHLHLQTPPRPPPPLPLLRTPLQARYDNVLLDVVTAGSAAVLLVRIVLGYQRMADRCAAGEARGGGGGAEGAAESGGQWSGGEGF